MSNGQSILLSTTEKGRESENLAYKYLITKAYRLITENYRAKCGEIDLIFFDRIKKELVFVEVRSCFGENKLLRYSLSQSKRMRLQKTIGHFCRSELCREWRKYPLRVDVVWVNQKLRFPHSIEHWINITI